MYFKLGNIASSGRRRTQALAYWERAPALNPDNELAPHEPRARAHERRHDRDAGWTTTDFAALTAKISRERGFGCASYKDKCLRRRIAVRMRARGVHTYATTPRCSTATRASTTGCSTR